MYAGMAPVEKLLQQQNLIDPEEHQNSWEIGRLVLNPAFRSGPELVRQCITLAVTHLFRESDAEHLFASCTHALSRLYRRFGFATIARDLCVEGSQDRYALIHARVDSIVTAEPVSQRAC